MDIRQHERAGVADLTDVDPRTIEVVGGLMIIWPFPGGRSNPASHPGPVAQARRAQPVPASPEVLAPEPWAGPVAGGLPRTSILAASSGSRLGMLSRSSEDHVRPGRPSPASDVLTAEGHLDGRFRMERITVDELALIEGGLFLSCAGGIAVGIGVGASSHGIGAGVGFFGGFGVGAFPAAAFGGQLGGAIGGAGGGADRLPSTMRANGRSRTTSPCVGGSVRPGVADAPPDRHDRVRRCAALKREPRSASPGASLVRSNAFHRGSCRASSIHLCPSGRSERLRRGGAGDGRPAPSPADRSAEQMRDLAGTDRVGTNLLGLVQAAEKLGLLGQGASRGRYEALPKVPLPAIAHVRTEDGAGALRRPARADRRTVVVADPARGVERCREEFCQRVDRLPADPRARPEDRPERPAAAPAGPWRRFLGLLGATRSVLLEAFVCALLMTLLGCPHRTSFSTWSTRCWCATRAACSTPWASAWC